jgi:uncharacterized protein (DUF433 family)
MTILTTLQSEIIDRNRAMYVSQMVRRFGDVSAVHQAIAQLPKDQVDIWMARYEESSVSLVKLEGQGSDQAVPFLVRPKNSIESDESLWKRDRAEVKELIVSARPGLWVGAASVSQILPSSCEERVIQGLTAPTAPTQSKPPASKAAVAPPTERKIEQQKSEPKKYTVPLDTLDPDEIMERKPDVAEDHIVVAPTPAPISVSDNTSVSSPQAKRVKTTAEEPTGSPRFREVVIKKKVIVTEYSVGENNEMIVKDVEKMVEETVMEHVRPAVPKLKSSAPSSSSGKSAAKPPPAGQATLTGYFKKN